MERVRVYSERALEGSECSGRGCVVETLHMWNCTMSRIIKTQLKFQKEEFYSVLCSDGRSKGLSF